MKNMYTSTQIKKELNISAGEFISYTRTDTNPNRIESSKGGEWKGNVRLYTDEDFKKFKLVKMLRKIGCNRTFAIELANKKYFENDFIKVILK